MSRADTLAVNDKAVQDFVLEGEITEAEVTAGAAQGRKWFSLRRLRLGFVASLAANGYIVFPKWLGGLVIQWGVADTLAAEAVLALSFPLAFPTACLCGVVSANAAVARNGGVNSWYFASPTQIGATLVNDGSSGVATGAFWIAIGN